MGLCLFLSDKRDDAVFVGLWEFAEIEQFCSKIHQQNQKFTNEDVYYFSTDINLGEEK